MMLLGCQLAKHAKTGSLEATPTTPSAKASVNGPPKMQEHGPHDAAVLNLMSQFQKLTRNPLLAYPPMLKEGSLAPTEKKESPPRTDWKMIAEFVRNQPQALGKAERLNLEHRRRHRDRLGALTKNRECEEPIAIKATIPRISMIGVISI